MTAAPNTEQSALSTNTITSPEPTAEGPALNHSVSLRLRHTGIYVFSLVDLDKSWIAEYECPLAIFRRYIRV